MVHKFTFPRPFSQSAGCLKMFLNLSLNIRLTDSHKLFPFNLYAGFFTFSRYLSLYDLHIRWESNRDISKFCDEDECCHVKSVKTQWHAASVINRRFPTRDPLNLILALLLYLLSLPLLTHLSVWISQSFTEFPLLGVSLLCFCLFVHVHMALPDCLLCALSSPGMVGWSRIAASSSWPSGPGVTQNQTVCVWVCQKGSQFAFCWLKCRSLQAMWKLCLTGSVDRQRACVFMSYLSIGRPAFAHCLQ